MTDSVSAREEEVPRPQIRYVCLRCGVRQVDLALGEVIVSPTSRAHFGTDGGDTRCGIDATKDGWWWPC